MKTWDLELEVGMAAAVAGGEAALPLFGKHGVVEWKVVESPVGEADHAADAAIRHRIRTAFPDDSILTEESGEQPGTSGRRWIVDPIDGTRDFLRGLSYWASLIALEADGQIVVGVLHLPALGKLYAAARGRGAWRDGVRFEIRPSAILSRCLLVFGELDCIVRATDADALVRLVNSIGAARGYGAPYGGALLLDGQADAWIEGRCRCGTLRPLPFYSMKRALASPTCRGNAPGHTIRGSPLLQHCSERCLTFCINVEPRANGLPEGPGVKRRQTMSDEIRHVLFLCTNNAVRSILAESLLNRLGQGAFRAYSAGSQPTGGVHPYAIELLAQHQYPTAHLRSKSWESFAGPQAPRLDFVFTLSDEVARARAPVWPGEPVTVHWGIQAPVAVEGDETIKRAAFAQAMQQLQERITRFIQLPFGTLDRTTVQRRLEVIGEGR